MTKFDCVRPTLLAVVFCSWALENHLTAIVSGCSDSVVPNGRDSPGQTPSPAGAATGCPCTAGGEIPASRYVNRTDVIKEDILRKLRMLNPPNATAQLRHMPNIPLLHSLIRQANDENDNRNQPRNVNDQEEDDHVMAMTILALSQPGVATVVS